MIPIPRERVHRHLHDEWMHQACTIHPADRSDVFAKLMAPGKKTEGEGMASANNHGRGSLRRLFNEAVDTLVMAFSAAEPPADPVDVVWRAFSRLDREHRERLAALLMKERANG